MSGSRHLWQVPAVIVGAIYLLLYPFVAFAFLAAVNDLPVGDGLYFARLYGAYLIIGPSIWLAFWMFRKRLAKKEKTDA